MNPIYKFYIDAGTGAKTPVYPIYKDDLALEYARESGQRFYRAKLSGKLTFVSRDYDLIMSVDFNTIYKLFVDKSDDGGLSYQPMFTGKFMRTDCDVDEDDRKIVLSPDTLDEYNDVLAGLEKEYNLVKLKPETIGVTYYKRPLIQIYIAGDNIVSCFLGGTAWEQDAEITTDINQLKETFHFSLMSAYRDINLRGNVTPRDAAGIYYGDTSGQTYYKGEYKLVLRKVMQPAPTFWFEIVKNGVTYFQTDKETPTARNAEPQPRVNELVLKAVPGVATGELRGTAVQHDVYGRMLCDVNNVDGMETFPIPDGDIVGDNRNYKRVIGYAKDVLAVTDRTSREPSEYGKKENTDLYYLPPTDTTEYYPIARSTWSDISLWFQFNKYDWTAEAKFRKQIYLRDAYLLSSCINVLLNEFAPGIVHKPTVEYSKFLYSTQNPISGWYYLFLAITPKSNILNGEYQTPAQKAPATLRDLLDMLKNVFNCYWWIENGKFKIEHISYFKNGGTYTPGSPNIQFDLTQMQNVRNGKAWDFSTSKYNYDKADMSARYQYKWMDDATKIFSGEPIDVLSPYVSAGKIEDINVSKFSSDIDFMLFNPGAISPDGFALLQPGLYDGDAVLQFLDQNIDGVRYVSQNGTLAFYNTIEKYALYDMPARRIRVNGKERDALGVERRKKQTINIPVGNIKPDPVQLVKTKIGNGEIEKISVNLSSTMGKTTLKYDTEK